MFPYPPLDMRSRCRSWKWKILDLTVQEHSGCFLFPNVLRFVYRVATQCSLSSLELRVQFCLLVCCTYPSWSTVNKEKNLIDQRASFNLCEWTREKHNRSVRLLNPFTDLQVGLQWYMIRCKSCDSLSAATYQLLLLSRYVLSTSTLKWLSTWLF